MRALHEHSSPGGWLAVCRTFRLPGTRSKKLTLHHAARVDALSPQDRSGLSQRATAKGASGAAVLPSLVEPGACRRSGDQMVNPRRSDLRPWESPGACQTCPPVATIAASPGVGSLSNDQLSHYFVEIDAVGMAPCLPSTASA